MFLIEASLLCYKLLGLCVCDGSAGGRIGPEESCFIPD